MLQGSAIGTRLRSETLTAHASIEEVALATGFMASLPAYHSYLRRMRGFYVGVERAFSACSELARWLPDVASRQHKSSLLEADLLALGDSRESILALPAYEANQLRVESAAAGLGAAYVVEGATLGGRYILSRLDEAVPTSARTFFEGYGSRTGAMWRAFCEALARHSATTG